MVPRNTYITDVFCHYVSVGLEEVIQPIIPSCCFILIMIVFITSCSSCPRFPLDLYTHTSVPWRSLRGRAAYSLVNMRRVKVGAGIPVSRVVNT